MSNRTTNHALYLAKIETAEGTAATIDPAVDQAIELIAPIDPDYDHAHKVERGHPVRGTNLNSARPLKPAGRIYSWTKSAWWRGRTTAPGAAAPFSLDPWLRSAGHSVTYSGGVGAEQAAYALASTGLQAVSETYFQDGLVYGGKHARADLSLSFDVGGPIILEHASQGVIFSGGAAAATPAGVFHTGDFPIATDATAFGIGGFAAGVIRRFALRTGNSIGRRDGVLSEGGVAGFRQGPRSPTWEVVLEEPLPATADFRAMVNAATDVAISWELGSSLYNRLAFSASGARVTKVTPSTGDSGLALVTLSGVFTDAGPYTLTAK